MPSRKPFKTNDGRLYAPVGIACPGKDLLQAAPALDTRPKLLWRGQLVEDRP